MTSSSQMWWGAVGLVVLAGVVLLAVDAVRRGSGKRGASTAPRRGSVEGALVASRSTGPRVLAQSSSQGQSLRRSDRLPAA